MSPARFGALAAIACLWVMVIASAQAQDQSSSKIVVPVPCFAGSPVTRSEAAPATAKRAIDAALKAKLATEKLALKVHFKGGEWPPVLAAAQAALQAAKVAFGASSECVVPFLEETGAAAAGAPDPKTAEAHYREALALLPGHPDMTFYRATLAMALANVLSRTDRADEASQVKAEATRLREEAQAADAFTDIYERMQSWVGATLLDPVFLGPTTGAQLLNDIATRTGVYGEAFAFQLNEIHAQRTLRGLPNLPDDLNDVLDHNRLQAIFTYADEQGDRVLLARLTKSQHELVDRLSHRAQRLEVDRERLALLDMLAAQGRVDEMRPVLSAIAPQSLAADEDLALTVHAQRADLMVLDRNAGGAAREMKLAQAARKPLPMQDTSDFFVLPHAVEELSGHRLEQAAQRLAPFTKKDSYGPQHQSQVLRMLAEIYHKQGHSADAVSAMRQAIGITEDAPEGRGEGPLAFGASQKTRELARSVDQAVSMALTAPGDTQLGLFAVEAVLRARGRQLLFSASRLHEIGMLPLGAERKLRELRMVRARLALELRDLGRFPHAIPNWPMLDAILQKEEDLQRDFGSQFLGPQPGSEAPDLPAIVARLGDKAAILVYASYRPYDPIWDALDLGSSAEPRMAVALLMRDRPMRWADIGTVAAVAAAVEQLRTVLTSAAATGDGSLDVAARTATTAAPKLLGPWFAELAHLKRIVMAPDGNLNAVPFAMLFGDGSKRDGPALSVISSIDDLNDRAASPTGPPAIFADIDFNAENVAGIGDLAGLPPAQPRSSGVQYAPLQKTADEARRIKALLPGAVVFSQAAATKAAFFDLHRPQVVHVATHGDFSALPAEPDSTAELLSATSNPMLRSALVFAGANRKEIGGTALATALEISTLDFDGTDLVVLSACDTGLGGLTAGEGVFGLRRAFVAAGAKRIVLSLWQVDDAATAFLMSAFYQALRDGRDVDEALARAQAETRQQPGWGHPYYWAGFILSGARGRITLTAPSAAAPLAKQEALVREKPLTGDVLWTYHAGAKILGSPATDGRTVFVGSEDGTLHALDRLTGKAIWRFSTTSKIYGQPQLADGRVFFGDHDGSVYALEEASGMKIWQVKVSGAIDASVTVDAGTVYAAADRLSALDASNGDLRWSYDPAAGLPPPPLASFTFRKFNAKPSIDQEFLYIGDLAGQLYKLRRSDGQVIWAATLGAGMVAQPILDARQVIVGTWGGSIAAFDRVSGAPLWRYESKDEIDGQILVNGTRVIFGAHGFGPLTALDTRTGALAWRVVLQTRGIWSLAAAGQQILIGSLNGLWLVDLADGQRRRLLDGEVTGSPMIQDGLAFVGSDDGQLYAIR
jgi:CHAT domain-containing protein/outer membrane protein assembly factor BamB